jgi:MoaA/NifB/PqqE/SkfB family radical SAM enzyme
MSSPEELRKPASELEKKHDFGLKLTQPSVIDRLRDYVAWQRGERDQPGAGPVSINLDLETACNFSCYFCVDSGLLNEGRMPFEPLKNSLELLCQKGLKSAIVMGGGEPTLYKKFEDTIKVLKGHGVSVAVITNGTGMQKIRNIGHILAPRDWVRVSIDAGTDETFQKIHRPKVPVHLLNVCQDVRRTRAEFPSMQLGYSFVITPSGDGAIGNIHEMVSAARLAKDYGFSYISFKPVLGRNVNYAEVVSPVEREALDQIRANLEQARGLENPQFKVLEANNLRALLNGYQDKTELPKTCHMQYFRHVLIPKGVFCCSGFRGDENFRLADNSGYSTEQDFSKTQEKLAGQIRDLDARKACDGVTCLYKQANQYIEALIRGDAELKASDERNDFFL